MQTYEWAIDKLNHARNKADGKPIKNNTRLFEREDGIAVKFHAVDVVTIHDDGTYTLRNGGWNTITTMERIRGYSPAKLFSVSGDWYVQLEPREDDPKPDCVERTIPKPFTALDPGPEPVKSNDGCIAPRIEVHEHLTDRTRYSYKGLRSDPLPLDGEVAEKWYRDGSGGRKAIWQVEDRAVFYGTERYNDAYWREYTGKGYWDSSSHYVDGAKVEYKQCPHCKAFDRQHDAWRHMYHGGGYGHKRFLGYKVYADMMRIYRSQEAWREAYLTDFRARKAYLKTEREWEARNRVPFYDGMKVDSDGYAQRLREDGPSPAKLRRHEAAVKKMRNRIDKYASEYIDALKAGMPMPSGGDCWYCSMSQSEDGTPMGDAMPTLYEDGNVRIQPNHEHLISHMEDDYYVPSLAVNALREAGYRDVGIYIWLEMKPEENTMGGPRGGDYKSVKRDLVKYMVKRLIPKAPTS